MKPPFSDVGTYMTLRSATQGGGEGRINLGHTAMVLGVFALLYGGIFTAREVVQHLDKQKTSDRKTSNKNMLVGGAFMIAGGTALSFALPALASVALGVAGLGGVLGLTGALGAALDEKNEVQKVSAPKFRM